MKDPPLSRAFKVVEPQIAAIFSDPQRRRLVLLLAAKARSLGELSSVTGLDLKRLHYHVTALHRLGLLRVTEQRARAGRAIKVYGAVASCFYVPAGTAIDRATERMTKELRHALGAMPRRPGEGTLYYVAQSGEARIRPVSQPAAPAATAVDHWRVLQLTQSDYLRLIKRIDTCLKEFSPPRHGKTKNYLLHFAMAPRK